MSRSETTTTQSTATRVTVATAADGSYVTSTAVNGRPDNVVSKNSGGTQIAKTIYGYDTHGRQSTINDARNGTTTLTFNAADAATSVTSPPPGTGQAAQTRQSQYDVMGRVWKAIEPDGGSLTNEFFLTGAVKKTYGTRA